MRGKVFDTLDNCVKDGITPAYAGKSNIHLLYLPPDIGSPPPMRGKEI